MAAKYMKVTRLVIPFITVVILTSQLLGYAVLSKNEMLEELQRGDEVVMEYIEPRTTLLSTQTSTPNYNYSTNTYQSSAKVEQNTQPEESKAEPEAIIDTEDEVSAEEWDAVWDISMKSAEPIELTDESITTDEESIGIPSETPAAPAPIELSIGLVENESTVISEETNYVPATEEPTQGISDELLVYFTVAYEGALNYTSTSLDDQLSKEVKDLEIISSGLIELPADHYKLYGTWRIATYGTNFKQTAEDPAVQSQVQFTFRDVNETIYANSNTYLQSGPNINYDIVGSLSTGQSATRTGIGTGDCIEWSRLQLSNGSIVYVNNKFITTKNPNQQQTQTQNEQSKTTQSGGTQSNSTQAPQTSGGWGDINPKAGLSEGQIQQILEESQNTEFRINGT